MPRTRNNAPDRGKRTSAKGQKAASSQEPLAPPAAEVLPADPQDLEVDPEAPTEEVER